MDTNCEVIIIDEGNCFYHLKDGTIDHQYYIDKNNEYATCQCGRVLWKKNSQMEEMEDDEIIRIYKKRMRSKTAQRILDKMEKDPWWVKLRRWFRIELHIIKCLGIVKYFKK